MEKINYDFIYLMPYPKAFEVNLQEKIKIIRLWLFFSKNCSRAINSFLLNKYSDFDAQVSDNLCQIRAYQFILFFEKVDSIKLNELKAFAKKIDDINKKC